MNKLIVNIVQWHVILLISLTIVSCSSEYDVNTRIVQKNYKMKNIVFDDNLKFCLIIPGGGCTGCIDGSINFLNNHIDKFDKSNSKIIVVFTAIDSLKKLKRDLNYINFENYNIIFDYQNEYIVGWQNDIYPIVLYLSNGIITEVDVQSPTNSNALDKLRDRL